MNLEIEKLVEEYGKKKQELDVLKKSVDALNNQIKAFCEENSLTECDSDNYIVKYNTRKSESFNEPELLIFAHMHDIDEIIKTKEYIDYDVLEDAIYNGRISDILAEQMQALVQVKETKALTVKKK